MMVLATESANLLEGVNPSNYAQVLSPSNIILLLIIAYLVIDKILKARKNTVGWLESFHMKRAEEDAARINLKEVMETVKVFKDQIDVLSEAVEDIKEMKDQLNSIQEHNNRLQNNDKLISEGFKCVLRQQIITSCEKYIDQSYISIKELEELEEVFAIYEKHLHGNGTAHTLVEEVRKLSKKTAAQAAQTSLSIAAQNKNEK